MFRVFHGPIELAGQMGRLVGGLRQFGHQAIGFNTFQSYLGYRNNIINTDWYDMIRQFDALKDQFDIFHFHFNGTLFEDARDLKELHALGKKFVMHHWGNDVRFKAKAAQLSPYLYDLCNPFTDEEIAARLARNSQYIKTAIIQDLELLPYVLGHYTYVYVLPLAFDVTGTIPQYPRVDTRVPLIIHAPTQPTFKGTVYVEDAIQRLRQAGFQFDYKRIEFMSNAEALSYYRQADIVIDQLLVGTYGLFAVEAMALGKPVISYLREDLVSTYPANLPIINANPTTLYNTLIPLITDPLLRHTTGIKSRQYAEQRHDIPMIIPQLLEIYKVVMST
ncbi:glycosyltransferase family 1 protein [Brevibacillus sp. SYP-B805]|uniref:glycosyltransferase n=1 Tax=Brevibacillus sp. SYP-B805 TaxID=1578199 RepID=UPI0019D21265|nr:glycosyltransferase family 1 protein [Brevibacillus sp. SYP-B805]